MENTIRWNSLWIPTGVLVVMGWLLSATAEGQYKEQWPNPLVVSGTGAASDQGTDIAADKDDYSYVCGQWFSTSTKAIFRIRSYNSTSNGLPVRWTRDYDPVGSPSSATHIPHHITLDGTHLISPTFVYVTGESPGANGSLEIATMKLSASTGALASGWSPPKRYANSAFAAGNDVGRFVQPDDQTPANVYVCGYSEGSKTGKDFVVLKYNSGGGPSADWPAIDASQPQGVRRYPEPNADMGDDDAVGLALGTVFGEPGFAWVCVAGTSWGGTTGDDIAVVMYNAGDGTVAWTRRYDNANGVFHGAETCVAVFASAGGDKVYVAGTSQHYYAGDAPLSFDFVVLAYDAATGNAAWVDSGDGAGVRRYDSGYNDVCYAAATEVDAPSTITLAGSSGSGNQVENVRWARWDLASGDFLWTGEKDGGVGLSDRALDVVSDIKGRSYLGGRGYRAAGQWDFMTLRVGTDGLILDTDPDPAKQDWPQWFSGNAGGNDTVNGIAINPSHTANPDVFVTGGAVRTNTGLDWTTVKYHYNNP